MAGGWDSFDWPWRVEHITRTKATVNQTTGIVSAPGSSSVDIAGNFEQNPLADEQRRPGAIIQEGDALLYTERKMKIADGVKIHFDASGTNFVLWRVKGLENDGSWFHIPIGQTVRYCYILQKEEVQ